MISHGTIGEYHAECDHDDCAAQREMAERRCAYCGGPLGAYDGGVWFASVSEDYRFYWHNACASDALELVAVARKGKKS